ncbi:VWA domain-containing protein [Pelagibius litoralis]|uniref:VWA domain-containing protein n=2 Tax=Pelagibius litoralis TaxID=374515 RepID=A0A967CA48_9PROT|nr:VWA domain-containing protein [Pelagibius litoralis]
MAPSTQSETPPDGRLAENILYFARTLRAAGLPVGPGKVLDALQATATVGLSRREDFYWTLHAIFVNRRDQQELFDQAFHMFWRNPKILERVMSLLLPDITPLAGHHPDNAEELSRRLTDVLRPKGSEDDALREEQEQTEIDAVMTFSSKEILQEIDFEKMSGAELAEAKRAIQAMRLPIMEVPTRRFRPAQQGQRADLRATMRAGLRSGGDTIPLRWKRQRRRHPPLVVLCDISGSMSRYSRMLLHFMHAVTNDRDRVHSFVFGTRLTNITRHLRHKDVDVAVEKVSDTVVDWSGGTRIGACLHDFNRVWARRVLGQGAVLLLISDGLDRDNAEGLAGEIERLHKSCRRLIWLNPLLRYDAYEPKSMGAKAMIGHVDDFRTIHNLESLSELSTVLSRPAMRREEGLTSWQSKKR